MKKTVALVAVVLCVTGCSHRTGDLTVLSTHLLSTVVEKAPDRDHGSSCSTWILFGLINFGGKSYKEAVDDVLNRHPQYDALVDVVTYDVDWGLLLFGQNCFSVEGTLARIGPKIDLSSQPIHLETVPTPRAPQKQ